MSISFESALGIHESALRVRGQRASVLADNLANVDTPNYKARDIDFKAMLAGKMEQTGRFNMQTTDAGHIGGAGMAFGAMIRIRKFELDFTRAYYHVSGASNFFTVSTTLEGLFKKKTNTHPAPDFDKSN